MFFKLDNHYADEVRNRLLGLLSPHKRFMSVPLAAVGWSVLLLHTIYYSKLPSGDTYQYLPEQLNIFLITCMDNFVCWNRPIHDACCNKKILCYSGGGCVYKSQYYRSGDHWLDGCDYNCTCVNGQTGFYRCVDR